MGASDVQRWFWALGAYQLYTGLDFQFKDFGPWGFGFEGALVFVYEGLEVQAPTLFFGLRVFGV